jgi:hypothetical protein
VSNDVKAALSPQEWAQARVNANGFRLAHRVSGGGLSFHGHSRTHPDVLPYLISPEEGHALAALALHGQPFGFTWQDVDVLRYEATQGCTRAAILNMLAYRIAALLPPR